MWAKLRTRLRSRFAPPRARALDELLERPGPVLALIAHPDDELFASGLLCELSTRGCPFHIACLTRGEGGMGGPSPEALGRIREGELRESAGILGAASVTFLGHVDPVQKAARLYAPEVSRERLADQLARLSVFHRSAFVITHGSSGEYGHPAHLLLHRAALRAGAGRVPIVTMLAWQASHDLPSLLNRRDPADLVIDGSMHRDRRLAAVRAHRSQHPYFLGHGGSLEAFVDLTACEAYRHYPGAK